jgi:hypothetical protein
MRSREAAILSRQWTASVHEERREYAGGHG